MKPKKTGLWLIGAYGDIATTLIVGTLALRRGLAPPTGLITETPPFNGLRLIPASDLVIGGHDVMACSVTEAAHRVCEASRTFSQKMLSPLSPELEEIDQNIVVDRRFAWDAGHTEALPLSPSVPVVRAVDVNEPGDSPERSGPAASLSALTESLRSRLREFATRHCLGHIVVVNLASAETHTPIGERHQTLALFEKLILEDDKSRVSPSMLCAYAAFLEGCSYVNFTPNPGSSIPALQELAKKRGLPHYGNDGKTGETLVKTALAPMFAMRNLRVLSWEGANFLGNNDGRVLDDPEHRKNKIKNKEAVLTNILGYPVHAGVGISYVPSLGDWKTAWDLIHFQGFLDVPMTMQFTWQGCDSILAAPLVFDMIRLAEFAFRCGESGLMKHLACFFKNPLGVSEHALHRQFDRLLAYAERHLDSATVRNFASHG